MKNVWQLQEAKNQFSLVVDNALTQGPQTVTRHGEPTVMVVSMAEFKKARLAEWPRWVSGSCRMVCTGCRSS